MKKIPLTRGLFTAVDDEDFERFSQFHWTALVVKRTGRVYAVRNGGRKVGLRLLHREILGLAKGDRTQADHEDGDSLNNCRENLRRASQLQNNGNRRKSRNNTSGFVGVCFDTGKESWRAALAGKFLGNFSDPADAARAYDAEARAYYGEFARLNFPG